MTRHKPHIKLSAQLVRQPGFTGRKLDTKSHPDLILFQKPTPTYIPNQIRGYLQLLLENLDGVEQSPKYHPEGDALYHSLQVFQHACNETNDPELWAAALFHDVGKAIDNPHHAIEGAEALRGCLSQRVVWLIEHHLDLLIAPRLTRRRLGGTGLLRDLERLRRWDLAGRAVDVEVCSIENALNVIMPYIESICSSEIKSR